MFNGLQQAGSDIRLNLFLETRLATEPIDGLVSGSLNNPGRWRIRDAVVAPLVDSSRKRLLGRLLSEVEVSERSDQRGHDPSPIGAVSGLHGGVRVSKHGWMIKNLGAGVDSGFRRSTYCWRNKNEIHAVDLPR